MSEPPKQPWYRKSLPPYIPGWLLLSLGMAGGGALLGYMSTIVQGDPTTGIRGAVIGAVVGFPVGVFFLSLVQARQLSRQSKGAMPLPEHMLPPRWLASIVSVVGLSLIGYLVVDSREVPGRRGRVLVTGTPAVLIGLALVAATSLVGIRIISQAARRSTFVFGILCLLISIVVFIFTVVHAITRST